MQHLEKQTDSHISNTQRVILVDYPGVDEERIKNFLDEGQTTIKTMLLQDLDHSILAEDTDVILLSVRDNHKESVEAISSIKKSLGSQIIPIIATSEEYDPSLSIKLLEAGANDIVPKPLDKTTFKAKVYAKLQLKNLHDEMLESLDVSMSAANLSLLTKLSSSICAKLQIGSKTLRSHSVKITSHWKNKDMVVPYLKDSITTANGMSRTISMFRNLWVDRNESEYIESNLDEIFQACFESFQSLFDQHQISFQYELDSKLAINPVNPLIGQILCHLFLNAIEAVESQPVKEIHLSCQARSDEITVSLRNSGLPILPEDQLRLFKPFFTTKSQTSHLGLGLFTASQIAQSIGAQCRYVRSDQTEFQVVFNKARG